MRTVKVSWLTIFFLSSLQSSSCFLRGLRCLTPYWFGAHGSLWNLWFTCNRLFCHRLPGGGFGLSLWMSWRSTLPRLFCFSIIVCITFIDFVILIIPTRFNVHHHVYRKQQLVFHILCSVLVSMHPFAILNEHFNNFNTFFLPQDFNRFVIRWMLLKHVVWWSCQSYPNFCH